MNFSLTTSPCLIKTELKLLKYKSVQELTPYRFPLYKDIINNIRKLNRLNP